MAHTHGATDPPHQQYSVDALKLENGESIRDFAISYVTHGQSKGEKSNAVLVVTAIGGNHHSAFAIEALKTDPTSETRTPPSLGGPNGMLEDSLMHGTGRRI